MRQLADWWNQSEELEDIVCIDIELFRMLKSAWVKSNKIILFCIKSAFFSPHYKFSTSRSSNTHTHTNLFVQLDFEKSYPNQTNFNAQSNWKSECICLSAFVLFVMQIFCARTHTHTRQFCISMAFFGSLESFRLIKLIDILSVTRVPIFISRKVL